MCGLKEIFEGAGNFFDKKVSANHIPVPRSTYFDMIRTCNHFLLRFFVSSISASCRLSHASASSFVYGSMLSSTTYFS